ncbi:MAG TPA: hypothetical protein VFH78_11620 [Candidatus Thermoplasmatota archaeon]|nr:hypothetical protein [Candidatus Thermoplasmatota archaeon]
MLWEMIRRHGLEAGAAKWEAWREERIREEDMRLTRGMVRLAP